MKLNSIGHQRHSNQAGHIRELRKPSLLVVTFKLTRLHRLAEGACEINKRGCFAFDTASRCMKPVVSGGLRCWLDLRQGCLF